MRGHGTLAAALALGACSAEEDDGVPGVDTGGSGGQTVEEGSGGSTVTDSSGGSSGGAIDTACEVANGETALCLTFTPEAVAAEAEPGLDQRGFFTVQVFDTPNPPLGESAAAVALFDESTPIDPGGEIPLAELPTPIVQLDGAPSVVFLRAVFVDNANALGSGADKLDWGTWVGGMDVAGGFGENAELSPVVVSPGEANSHDVPLFALRRVTVDVTTSVDPVGDGEGSLSVVASRIAALPPDVETHGYGIEPCVDITTGPQRVDIAVVGSGTFFVTGFFDDLGVETPGALPPGTMLSVDPTSLDAGSPAFDQLTLVDDQYSGGVSIDMRFVSSLPGGAAPGPNSCEDLGFPRNAR